MFSRSTSAVVECNCSAGRWEEILWEGGAGLEARKRSVRLVFGMYAVGSGRGRDEGASLA